MRWPDGSIVALALPAEESTVFLVVGRTLHVICLA